MNLEDIKIAAKVFAELYDGKVLKLNEEVVTEVRLVGIKKSTVSLATQGLLSASHKNIEQIDIFNPYETDGLAQNAREMYSDLILHRCFFEYSTTPLVHGERDESDEEYDEFNSGWRTLNSDELAVLFQQACRETEIDNT